MRYAGFWPRLGAITVDVLILAPLFVIRWWSWSGGKLWIAVVAVAVLAVSVAYNILMLARYGQTVGKMATRIRVIMLDGTPVSMHAAFLRHSVDIIFALFIAGQLFLALKQLPSGGFDTLSRTQKMWAVRDRAPTFRWFLDWSAEIWFWSELLVLWLNEKRRALHDFMAGTVVIHVDHAQTTVVAPTAPTMSS